MSFRIVFGGSRMVVRRAVDALPRNGQLPVTSSQCWNGARLCRPRPAAARGTLPTRRAVFIWIPLSPTLSPLVPRGEREETHVAKIPAPGQGVCARCHVDTARGLLDGPP